MNELTRRRTFRDEMTLLPMFVESQQGFRFLPLGFLFELGLLLILAATVPGAVPRIMELIWPETARA